MWDELLQRMSASGGSPAMLAEVLSRVALADGPVSRSVISKGGMLFHPAGLAVGTVKKAADGLVGENLLAEEGTAPGRQPGPPATALRLGDEWAIIGIHIDQQHEGRDALAGIICGLNRKPLTDLVLGEVPRKGDEHDLDRLAEEIHKLTRTLLRRLDGPRKFLGVGVEIGGHVWRGVVEDSVHAGWSQKVDLEKILMDVPELKGIPGVAENDTNALAIHGYYEHSFRQEPGKEPDIVLLAVLRQGVGGALILDDHTYRGVHGMAPEPGHLDVEYPEDNPAWTPPDTPSPAGPRTFGDECLCSTTDRKKYGHLDTLAVPARIEGQLAALKGAKVSLEKAAAEPRLLLSGNTYVASVEAVVLRRAGRALGRAIAHMINTLNPSQLVLRLPEALARPAAGSSGIDYLDAAESELNRAYSTGPADARGQHSLLTIQPYAEQQVALDGAVASATTVFNAFIEHAHGRDGCDTAGEGSQRPGPAGGRP
jgi:predicted NBD/HSP70 family sugar kinase